jgi:hypothetical protein
MQKHRIITICIHFRYKTVKNTCEAQGNTKVDEWFRMGVQRKALVNQITLLIPPKAGYLLRTKITLTGCPETPASQYQSTLRTIPEEPKTSLTLRQKPEIT